MSHPLVLPQFFLTDVSITVLVTFKAMKRFGNRITFSINLFWRDMVRCCYCRIHWVSGRLVCCWITTQHNSRGWNRGNFISCLSLSSLVVGSFKAVSHPFSQNTVMRPVMRGREGRCRWGRKGVWSTRLAKSAVEFNFDCTATGGQVQSGVTTLRQEYHEFTHCHA